MIDSRKRAELVREGNAAFNDGDYRKAKELFVKAGYRDGLIRLGDYYMYERRLPLLAYGYYKKAGAEAKVQDIHRRMLLALSQWIGREHFKEGALPDGAPGESTVPLKQPPVDREGMIPVPVSPRLKEAALKILQSGRG